jgi:hypothetical protein
MKFVLQWSQSFRECKWLNESLRSWLWTHELRWRMRGSGMDRLTSDDHWARRIVHQVVGHRAQQKAEDVKQETNVYQSQYYDSGDCIAKLRWKLKCTWSSITTKYTSDVYPYVHVVLLSWMTSDIFYKVPSLVARVIDTQLFLKQLTQMANAVVSHTWREPPCLERPSPPCRHAAPGCWPWWHPPPRHCAWDEKWRRSECDSHQTEWNKTRGRSEHWNALE